MTNFAAAFKLPIYRRAMALNGFSYFRNRKYSFQNSRNLVSSALGQLLIIHGSTACFFGEKSVPLSAVGFLFYTFPLMSHLLFEIGFKYLGL
ncbi:hypothetical protein VIS19158_04776 [Vibrio scophthalmi LMG 19158]|uniref:Uncharacterized protein n=1 Tax=Vibrio scophthalmi LMG 19158 TaxID=870967 RepID=F9RJK2_9VIBR|nr:hypothetical protein VIS19158_04776 [Vibrio scophthalmi LMG 19158]